MVSKAMAARGVCMINNDILIRIRYALNITDFRIVELFALAGRPMTAEAVRQLFAREGDAGFAECDGPTLGAFLEGLIIIKRGRKETPSGELVKPAWSANPTNNDVLKALRIALELREDDVLALLKLAGVDASKPEVNALFRSRDHQNFRPCGDQFLRNFLVGITKKYRVGA